MPSKEKSSVLYRQRPCPQYSERPFFIRTLSTYERKRNLYAFEVGDGERTGMCDHGDVDVG